ncbi:MAG: DUF2807 domain-containing protein [Chloroflexi bacterium]|nr:DUF2807 domain-containing protein [Chloroflexota bacterium]
MPFGFDVIHGSGNIQTRDYDIKNFRSVQLAGIGSLSIQQTGEESIRIEADDNLFEYLRVELRGSELFLGLVNNINLRPPHTLKFYVTVKDIEAISLAGSGEIHTSSLTGNQIKIEIAGSGDIDAGSVIVDKGLLLRIAGSGKADIASIKSLDTDIIITGFGKIRIDEIQTRSTTIKISGSGGIRVQKIATDTVESHISGSGDIELQGKTVKQNLSISSAGKYKCENLESDRTDISISGSGSAIVSVKERLDARISGSGSIHYRGKPVVVMSISGAGKVKSLE